MSYRNAFLDAIKAVRAKKTVEAYSTASKKFEQFLAKWDKTLEQAPKNALSAFSVYLSRSGLAPASVHLYVNGATQYINWCRENGVSVQEMKKPRMPRVREHIPVILKEQALATYIEVARSVREPYGTALALLPMTGLRVGEMCRLEMTHVVIKRPWVRFVVMESKSKADRTVPMLKQGKPLLGHYLKNVRPGLLGDRWLFPNRDGNPISKRLVQEEMRAVRAELGIEHLTPHTLRHTYLTILNENGITGFDLAEIAGHKNLSTSWLYVHPDASRLSREVENIDLPLTGRKPKDSKK